MSSESSSSSSEDESESSDDEEVVKSKSKGRKRDGPTKEENATKESKAEEKAVKLDTNVQSNIDDLAERFKRLELKLGERANNRESLPPKTRTAMYCIMCGKQGHGIHDCSDSKFFISQDICRMDVNNRVVMSDGSALPRAEGEGGAARIIHDRLSGVIPSSSGPTATSASNVEVVAAEADYEEEPDELAILGSMEWEVLPADRAERSKRYKPYDRQDMKKGAEKTTPDATSRPRGPPPNKAYVELPPTILKRTPPAKVVQPSGDDQEMVDGSIPTIPKGKQWEQPVIVPTLPREPVVLPQESKEHASVPKETPRFKVVNPKSSNNKSKNLSPQYKYATELMNETNQEHVFQKLLDQPVTLKLGELLGTSYDLGRRFQTMTHSQRFPVQQAKAMNVEILNNVVNEGPDSEAETADDLIDLSGALEFAVNSGEVAPSRASTEELHETFYQNMMEEEFQRQFAQPTREVNLARPHEYRAMVTARLNGRIGEQDYMMLVDSGSELNIMMLHQAQELALPIDDSGSSWTLKGISGHMMGLEGICWNVPVKIGGIEFSHNFFITRSSLGNKDMVLGQPWLFSHSTRIDYVHEMGVTLQLWENGDRKGRSILINLPLVKAPRNVMPVRLRRDYESYSATCTGLEKVELANPGTASSSSEVPRFMNRAVEALHLRENKSEKPRPVGINEDLILDSSLSIPFVAEVMKCAWFVSVKEGNETLSKRIERLKREVGISPIYDSAFTDRESNGAKYKPVAKKVVPVSAQDPEATIPAYKDIEIREPLALPVIPK